MILTLKRERCTGLYTEGKLYVDGRYYCDTLEDAVRPDGKKVPGETAIPFGTYRVIMTMSNRFKRLMPLLVDVPGFAGVRIHAGNSAKDTEGCILTGRYLTDGLLTRSREATNDLYLLIAKAINNNEKVEIEII